MPIELTHRTVERGYHHDETGRWIDTSYRVFRVTVSGQRAMTKCFSVMTLAAEELRRRLARAEVFDDEDNRAADAELEEAKGRHAVEFREYAALPWWRRLFRSAPPVPERRSVNLRAPAVREALEDLVRRTDELAALDWDVADFVIETRGHPYPLYTQFRRARGPDEVVDVSGLIRGDRDD